MAIITLLNLFILSLIDGINFTPDVNTAANLLPVNTPLFIIVGIVLIIVTILIIFFIKKVIINSIIGAIMWAIALFVFHVNLPLIPSLVVSIIIGPAGIGAMLLLNALGLLAI